MSRDDLPSASGEEIVRCLVEHFGFSVARRSKKNHFILARPGSRSNYSIPDHRQVKRDLLHAILRLAGIDDSQFAQTFRKRRS